MSGYIPYTVYIPLYKYRHIYTVYIIIPRLPKTAVGQDWYTKLVNHRIQKKKTTDASKQIVYMI